MSLSDNYKRVLASLTEIVDRTVSDLIILLEEPGADKGIIRQTDLFTPGEKREKILKLRRLQEENRRFFEGLGTGDIEYSERQTYNAKITRLWTLLNDSLPGKLKGYGKLEEKERVWITENVERLLRILEDLK